MKILVFIFISISFCSFSQDQDSIKSVSSFLGQWKLVSIAASNFDGSPTDSTVKYLDSIDWYHWEVILEIKSDTASEYLIPRDSSTGLSTIEKKMQLERLPGKKQNMD